MADRVVIQGEERLRRRFERLLRGISAGEVLNDIGLYLTMSIKRRTQEDHLDISGRAFKPYTPKYALWRTKRGYGTNVDLTRTGSLMNSLTHEAYSDRVKIFFMPGTDKSGMSNPAKAFYLQDQRKFFGYTNEDVTKIMEIYQVNIRRSMHGSE